MRHTAWSRTSDKNQPRVSIFALKDSKYKTQIEGSISKRQKQRRQQIFLQYRIRKLELEKNEGLTAEQIHEILRKEVIDQKYDKIWEEEAAHIGYVSIEELIEMEREAMHSCDPSLLAEAEYVERLNQQYRNENTDKLVPESSENINGVMEKSSKQNIKTNALFDSEMYDTGIDSPPSEKYSVTKWPVCCTKVVLEGTQFYWGTDNWINIDLVLKRPELEAKFLVESIEALFEEHNADIDFDEDKWQEFIPELSLGAIVHPHDSIVVNCQNCNFLEFCEL